MKTQETKTVSELQAEAVGSNYYTAHNAIQELNRRGVPVEGATVVSLDADGKPVENSIEGYDAMCRASGK